MSKRVRTVTVVAAGLAICSVSCIADAAWRWTPEIGRFIRVTPHVAATPEEQLDQAAELYRDGDYDEAYRTYEKFFDYFPDSELADQVQFGLAECSEARGDLLQASEEYQKLIANYRDSDLYTQVVAKQYEIADRFYQMYVNRKGLGRLTAGRKLRHAIEVYTQVIDNDPFGAGSAEAQYRLAECYFVSNKLEEAKLEYRQVVEQFPSSRRVHDARFYLALCEYLGMLPARYDQEGAKNALRGFSRYVRDAPPDHEHIDQAREYITHVKERLAEHDYLVARFYERRGRLRAALASYQTLIQTYPGTSFAEKAQTYAQAIVDKMVQAGTLVVPPQSSAKR